MTFNRIVMSSGKHAYPIRPLPCVEYLRECFDRDPEIRGLRWRVRPKQHFKTENRWASWNNVYAGTQAGTIKNHHYEDVGINGVLYKLHRIVWKLGTGDEPPEFLDHIDGNRNNNRLENLRPATRTEQKWNSCLYKNNRSGRRGVSKRSNGWIARIKIHGVSQYLGTFETIEAAAVAYENAARKLHGEFFRRQNNDGA